MDNGYQSINELNIEHKL